MLTTDGSCRRVAQCSIGSVRTVAEHQRVIAGLIRLRRPVVVSLTGAAGRVLAEDLRAARPLPAFDNSAMDGYAVLAVDIATASASNPVTLPVVEDIPAGRVDGPPLKPGTAHRIMTGAAMPAGADTIVPVAIANGSIGMV